MPAGDPQRTWFPEMLEILRARWHVGLPIAELIQLRDELDTMLHRIRAERHIRPPVIRCPRCGHVGEAAEPDVSVRAMILSLGRFGMAPAEQVKTLEKRWAGYRKQNSPWRSQTAGAAEDQRTKKWRNKPRHFGAGIAESGLEKIALVSVGDRGP